MPTSRDSGFPSYTDWLKAVSPELSWDWPHLVYARNLLADVTLGHCDRLAISWPPQHAKTQSVSVRYPLWRMLREPEPGLRVGVASYNQRYANKISRWTRRIVRRLGYECTGRDAADEWELPNGSTFIARGAGGGIAGEPLDLLVIDDPFKNREEADSQIIQEKVYEWYMDDVTPRIQEHGAVVIIHTRWNPGDLIGRIKDSEEGSEWTYITLKAICDGDDPSDLADAYRLVGREPRSLGDALCPERFGKEKLEQKRRVEGVGFESLYQQNPIPRGGTFFQRDWFGLPVAALPDGAKLVRYWDLACLSAGTQIETQSGPKSIEDVRAGDFVLTRHGYRRVKRAWLTKYVDELTTVRFTSGAVLTGTADHLVWTENRGWVELGKLSSSDYSTSIHLEGTECQDEGAANVYRTPNSSCSTGSLTHAGRGGNTSRRTAGTRSGNDTTPSLFIKPFGNSTTGQSPSVMTFTTSMGTTTTTPSRTWSASARVPTPVCTTASGISTVLRPRTNTTGALSARCGRTRFFVSFSASGVDLNGGRDGRGGFFSVPTSAAKSTAKITRRLKVSVPVYDLEVEDAHEFFANGILVHNSSRLDSACYTSGVLIASVGDAEAKRFYVVDVIRGRWMPAERNDVMLQTAIADATRPGFARTWFEEPVFDKGKAAMRGIMAKLAGYPVAPHKVSGAGSKELRAEPLADAAKAGLVRVVAGSWVAAWLTEMESFPRGQWKDQVDSSSGGYSMLNRGEIQFFT